MKVRLGFVSNSSSSSFTIFYQDIDFEDIKSVKGIYVEGKYLGEGVDFFPLTKEILSYMKRNIMHISADLMFYDVFKKIDKESFDYSNREILKKDLPKKFKVVSKEGDNHYTTDLKQFKENYCEEEEKQ